MLHYAAAISDFPYSRAMIYSHKQDSIVLLLVI